MSQRVGISLFGECEFDMFPIMRYSLVISAMLAIVILVISAESTKGADGEALLKKGPPLVEAADRGDLDTVKKLLANGENPDEARTEAGSTALMRAAFRGHIEVMKVLVDNGAKVNTETPGRDTALLDAADGGHVEAASLLIEKGADIKHADKFNATALHRAVEFGGSRGGRRGGSVAIAKLLLEKGADVNAKAYDGWTPLHCTLTKSNKEMVDLLIAKGADVNMKSDSGKTVLGLYQKLPPFWQDAVTAAIIRVLIDHGAKE